MGNKKHNKKHWKKIWIKQKHKLKINKSVRHPGEVSSCFNIEV